MSQRKPPPTKTVISRRVLLAAGGLVVLGEFIAGEGSGAANDTARLSANGSRSAATPAPRPGQTTHPSSAAHPTATPRDVSSSSAAQSPPANAAQPAGTPTAKSTAGKPSQPMYYIDDGPKTIALTIDDGPDSTYTPQVLKLLQKYKVTATF